MTDIAMYGSISYDIDDKTTLNMLAQAGIKEVFLWWAYKFKDNCCRLKTCKELGLKIQTAHLEYKDINSIWKEGKAGDKLVKKYAKNLKQLKKYNIPIAVLHASQTKNPPPMSLIGLKRYQTLIKYAEKYGIIVALENSRKLDYFDYIYSNISSDYLRVCYDSGHNHTFTSDQFDFDKYKNQIVCLHLHDNDTTRDKHQLPFDGDINWLQVLTQIKKSGYKGPMTLEVVMGDEIYKEISPQDFIKKAKESAIKLANMYDKIKV